MHYLTRLSFLLLLTFVSTACSKSFVPLKDYDHDAAVKSRVGGGQTQRGLMASRVEPGESGTRPMVKEPRLRDTPEVRAQLRVLTTTQRRFVIDGLKRREQYLPTIRRVFDEYGLPIDLANIAFLESRFIPQAKNPSGAAGLWQFTKTTGRNFGLKISLWDDERLDVEKSTVAAAKYLLYLYKKFDDWSLAIAAYNAGGGRMRKVIERCGETNFFELADCGEFSKETRDFVARFIALTIVIKHLDLYGFEEERLKYEG